MTPFGSDRTGIRRCGRRVEIQDALTTATPSDSVDMPIRYQRAHDLDSWRTDRRIAERGFTHPWTSTVADGNGEDLFLDLLESHLNEESVIVDVGCGHGELTL